MRKNSRTQSFIDELCQKLHCSELADDVGKINYARERLAHLQQLKVLKKLDSGTDSLTKILARSSEKISNILPKTKQRLDAGQPSFSSIEVRDSKMSSQAFEQTEQLEGKEYYFECDNLYEDDTWLGFFPGYEILERNQQRILSENKQCIELSLQHDNATLEHYLRAGIRCFMIDLFIGTELEKQKIIFKLRECELKVSREYGFPITTTLFAMLSPRLQFTGQMDVTTPLVELEKGHKLILTTKTKYCTKCNVNKVYVNAGFLIEDCREYDFILLGPTIQLMVTETLDEELKCTVVEGGLLSSRLPVRFPARCWRLDISLEELENITFAREVGINVLVSYQAGSQQYLKDLQNALHLLKCDNLRLFTRLVLTDYSDEKTNELEWIADSYEGFYVDFSAQQYDKCCQVVKEYSAKNPGMLNLSPACVNFMTKIYKLKKPIVLNPARIAAGELIVQPCHVCHIFYYPDKFIFSKENYNNALSFYRTQMAMSEKICSMELSKELLCDEPEFDEAALARACVVASFQCQAKAIVVCSDWPDMSIDLSHFRPRAPIIHVSAITSLGDYLSLYHHLIFMRYQLNTQNHYAGYVLNAFIFCLSFLKTRNILLDGENVLLVYGTGAATKVCDKYLIYRFNKNYFAKTLGEILFV